MSTTDFNPNDLERRLTGQPFRRLPPEWRNGILKAAHAAHGSRAPAPDCRPSAWCRAALWPSPAAWAGVATAWVAILILNHAGRWEPLSPLAGVQRPPVELGVVLIEHRRQLDELLEVAPVETAPGPSPLPTPSRPAPRGALTRTNHLA